MYCSRFPPSSAWFALSRWRLSHPVTAKHTSDARVMPTLAGGVYVLFLLSPSKREPKYNSF